MLNINFIRENQELIIERLKIKNFDALDIIKELLGIDDARKALQFDNDNIIAEQKQLSKSIGQLFKEGKTDEAQTAKEKTGSLKTKIQENTHSLKSLEEKRLKLLYEIPNIPNEIVPPGKSEEANQEVDKWGEIVEPSLKKPHWETIEVYDIIDFELGTKITGAGFPVYKGKGAKLQRALISFFLDEGENAGYLEVLPPLMVNEASGFGTGQLPDKDGQMYDVTADHFYLIPTAEVPVTNIYRDVIIPEQELPKQNIAYSACFRREAGSWGSHVRGLNRLHQFDKVEIVRIEHPDKSYEALEQMKAHVGNLLKKLNLPYRILLLCGGDLSFTSALTYDFEVYSAGQDRWLEVSSVSNFEDYQANRLKLRFREKENNKLRTAHTLNGSALALPRIMAALIENNLSEDGIVIPEVLRKYTGFDIIENPKK
ncbi:MAG: serine--tRNA ligase [Bacteroidales bacterium]|jgi:seryl-tRNA synthetase|nr:serine--tRNA ligase [Bacteroidales bacterium]